MVYHTPTPSQESRRRTGHECRHFPFLTREQARTCGNTNSIIRDDHLHRNITIDLGSRRPSASTLDSMYADQSLLYDQVSLRLQKRDKQEVSKNVAFLVVRSMSFASSRSRPRLMSATLGGRRACLDSALDDDGQRGVKQVQPMHFGVVLDLSTRPLGEYGGGSAAKHSDTGKLFS